MRPFAYLRPDRLDDLLALLTTHGPDARVLAGGTDLIVRLRVGHVRPTFVIDVKRVAALRAEIAERDGCLNVGARVVMADLVRDERVRRLFPALAEAAAVVGSVQIRHRATLVGNICNASPAADTAPALLVYGAAVNIVGGVGARRVALADFFTGPGRTVLERGEVVESIDLPLPSDARGAAFGRVTRRFGVDIATINVCCLVEASGRVRFAYGAVSGRPLLVDDESGLLADEGAPATARSERLERLIRNASPISDVRGSREYRLAMLEVMSRRTLHAARDRLRGSET